MRRQTSLGIPSEGIGKQWWASTFILPGKILQIAFLCFLRGQRQRGGDGHRVRGMVLSILSSLPTEKFLSDAKDWNKLL